MKLLNLILVMILLSSFSIAIDCVDSDINCVNKIENNVSDEIQQNINQEKINENTYLPQSFLASFENRRFTTFETILVAIGLILFSWLILEGFNRVDERIKNKAYRPLIPYAQSALEKGYSGAQIKESLKSKGYDKEFIKGFMEALEHRP